MAKYAGSIDIFDRSEYDSFREYYIAEEKEVSKMFDKSSQLDYENGEIVGAMLKWQRGDGYALYQVVNDDPLTVVHLNYGDAWRVEPALIRGLRKQDIIHQLERQAGLRKLFGGK